MEPIVSPCFLHIFCCFFYSELRPLRIICSPLQEQADWLRGSIPDQDWHSGHGACGYWKKRNRMLRSTKMKASKEHENNKKGNARNIRRYELGFYHLLSLSLSPVLKWVSQSCASQLKLGYWPKTTAKIARSYYIQWVDETWLARQRALNPLRCCLRRPLFRRWIMFITSVGSHMRLMTVSSMATQMVNRSVFAWINQLRNSFSSGRMLPSRTWSLAQILRIFLPIFHVV